MEIQRAFLEAGKSFRWTARDLQVASRGHFSDNGCVSVASRAV